MSFLPNRRKLQLFLHSFERKNLSHISPLPRNMTHRIGVTNPGNDEIREIHSRFDRRRLRGGNASIKWRWGGARVERPVGEACHEIIGDKPDNHFAITNAKGNRGPGDGPRNTTEINRDVIDRLSLFLSFSSSTPSSLRTKLMHCQSGENEITDRAHRDFRDFHPSRRDPSIFHC